MRVNHGIKKPPDVLGRLSFFSRCVYFFVTILTSATTSGLSFVRRRTIIRLMTISSRLIRYILGFLSTKYRKSGNKKAAPGWGGLCFSKLVSLFHSHRCHPNRQLVLKNKDRNNNDKDEGGENCLHDFFRVFRPIIGAFEDKSRANHGNFMLFTQS